MSEHDHHSHDHDHHGHAHGVEAYLEAVASERELKDEAFRRAPWSPIPAESRADFHGLAYWPVDPDMRVSDLELRAYDGSDPVRFAIPTSDGQLRPAERAGVFAFDLGGASRRLTAYRLADGSGGALFVPFLDATSGTETYGAGRYLDVEPGPDGRYVLDFNLAYQPYCAYSPWYSCPLTPEENRLGLRVEAGERLDPAAG
jgi:uncharacterized protein (DUF1684 family)